MTSYGWLLPQQADDKQFTRYLEDGEFRLQCCTGCSRFRHPARWVCPFCGSGQYEWKHPAGTGTVTSVAWYFQNLLPGVHSEREANIRLPYNAVVVRLDEGPFLMARVEGVEFGDLAVGDRVIAKVSRALVSEDAKVVFNRVES